MVGLGKEKIKIKEVKMLKRKKRKINVSFTVDAEVYEQICQLFWQTRCRSLSEFVNSIFSRFIEQNQEQTKKEVKNE